VEMLLAGSWPAEDHGAGDIGACAERLRDLMIRSCDRGSTPAPAGPLIGGTITSHHSTKPPTVDGGRSSGPGDAAGSIPRQPRRQRRNTGGHPRHPRSGW